jgi:hypothetical protein
MGVLALADRLHYPRQTQRGDSYWGRARPRVRSYVRESERGRARASKLGKILVVLIDLARSVRSLIPSHPHSHARPWRMQPGLACMGGLASDPKSLNRVAC